MRLWLLRHGQAEPRARTDAERRLTDTGRAEARQAARLLEGRPLAAMLVSPYVRAQQTADEVCRALGYRGLREQANWATPESDVRDAMLQLDRRSEIELIIVTHQPFVGTLGGWLVDGHRQNPLSMVTGSLAELEGDAYAAGLMRLLAIHDPII